MEYKSGSVKILPSMEWKNLLSNFPLDAEKEVGHIQSKYPFNS